MVPYEREFKRWAGDTSASVWRDTKMYVGKREEEREETRESNKKKKKK